MPRYIQVGNQKLREIKSPAFSTQQGRDRAGIPIQAGWLSNHLNRIGYAARMWLQVSSQDPWALSSLYLGLLAASTCDSACRLLSWLQEQAQTTGRPSRKCWQVNTPGSSLQPVMGGELVDNTSAARPLTANAAPG